jgi:hypothetical protein
MNEQQQQAMDLLVEWRDAIHQCLLDEVVTGADGAIWWSLLGIRSAMTKVTDSFGLAGLPQDSSSKVGAN